MSWKASPRSRAVRQGGGVVGRLEDRQHHLADHRRRAVHVDQQIVVGLVACDGEVHRHRAQEAAEAVGVDVEGRARCAPPPSAPGRRSARRRGRRRSGRRSRRGRVSRLGRSAPPAEVVDDVVGVAAEGVQGVHVVALDRGSTHGRPVVRGAVALVELAGTRVALLEGRSRRTAAASASVDASARPSCVAAYVDPLGRQPARHQHHRHADAGHGAEPDEHQPGHRRSTLFGRNGPVWRNVWASANGVPRSMPCASQSSGSYTSLDLDVGRVAERPRPASRRLGRRSGRARVVQSTWPSRLGTGSST